MKTEELKMIAAMYQTVAAHKINLDKRYSNIEALCDCIDAAAYFWSAVDNASVENIFEGAKHNYKKEMATLAAQEGDGVLEQIKKLVKQ